MKKIYKTPYAKVVMLNASPILAGSMPVNEEDVDEALSKESAFEFDNEYKFKYDF